MLHGSSVSVRCWRDRRRHTSSAACAGRCGPRRRFMLAVIAARGCAPWPPRALVGACSPVAALAPCLSMGTVPDAGRSVEIGADLDEILGWPSRPRCPRRCRRTARGAHLCLSAGESTGLVPVPPATPRHHAKWRFANHLSTAGGICPVVDSKSARCWPTELLGVVAGCSARFKV